MTSESLYIHPQIAAWPYGVLTLMPEFQTLQNSIGFEQKASCWDTATKPVVRPTARQITRAIEKRNWSLQLAGKSEAVLFPDFWNEMPNPGKCLNALWEAVDQNPRTHLIIPTLAPEQFSKALPPYFAERPYPNVHLVAVLGDSPDDNARRTAALLKTPARSRGLWPGKDFDPAQLEKNSEGIHFIMADTARGGSDCDSFGRDESSWHLHELCTGRGLAFVPIPAVGKGPGPGEAPLVLPYPFPQGLPMGESHSTESAPDALVMIETSSAGCGSGDQLGLVRPQSVNRKSGRTTGRMRREPRPSGKRPAGAVADLSDVAEEIATPSAAPDASNLELIVPEIVTASPFDEIGRVSGRGRAQELEAIVRKGQKAFFEAGLALREIRDDGLWRESGHSTFDSYCLNEFGFHENYANRIAKHAWIALELSKAQMPLDGTGKPILPQNEGQVRPMAKLKDSRGWSKVWKLSIKRAGGTPTGVIVAEVVSELNAGKSSPKLPSPSRKGRLNDTIRRLRQAIEEKHLNLALEILTELEAAT